MSAIEIFRQQPSQFNSVLDLLSDQSVQAHCQASDNEGHSYKYKPSFEEFSLEVVHGLMILLI